MSSKCIIIILTDRTLISEQTTIFAEIHTFYGFSDRLARQHHHSLQNDPGQAKLLWLNLI